MRKIILKRTHYHKLPETIFGVVVSAVFLGLILFEILSGGKDVSDTNLIGGGAFLLYV